VKLIEVKPGDLMLIPELSRSGSAKVFRCGPARGPQLSQRGIEFVQVRAGRDLVHPRRGEPRRGRQRADRDSLRAG
jgi:hypothetical protein